MRTAVAASANSNKTTKLAKSGVAAPAPSKLQRASDDASSSFDEVLKGQRSQRPQPESEAKVDRSKKKENATPINKPRAKKKTDETDPAQTAACSDNQAVKPKPQPTSETDEHESDVDATTTNVEAVESNDEQTTEEDDAPDEQMVQSSVAVPMDGPAPGAAASTEHPAEQAEAKPTEQIQAHSTGKLTPVRIDVPANEKVGTVAADADGAFAIDGDDATTPIPQHVALHEIQQHETQHDVPVESSDDVDVNDVDPALDQQQAPAPQLADAHQLPKTTTTKTVAAADPLGAKPIAPAAKSDGQQHSSDHNQSFSGDPALAAIAMDQPWSDSTDGEFSFDPEQRADVKPIEAASAQADASMLGLAKLDAQPAPSAQPVAQAQPMQSPERVFANDNHANIVSNVRTNLMPNGGTMQITLNPPELGAIQVAVQMRDGVMNASFETTSDQATRLLSHSLGELRTSLENSGVAVDKLHVEQAPKNQQSQNHTSDDRQQQGQSQDSSARREQERRELLQRMWRRLSEGSDPLDMVA